MKQMNSKAILILNTGSPQTKEKKDVEWFIATMLSDPLVLSAPDWYRTILAKKIIAPLRASRAASHYDLIWDEANQASPLIYNTQCLAQELNAQSGLPVEIAMRYGMPEMLEILQRIQADKPRLLDLHVLPMFPQHAQSSYQTAVEELIKTHKKKYYSFKLKILKPFFKSSPYIKSLATSLKPYTDKAYDKLVFSFHSLPLDHVQTGKDKGFDFDYEYQIEETIRLLSEELDLDTDKNCLVYSSAIGRKWLKPSLDKTIKSLPRNGAKQIIVICPGFPADNLETLYDIDLRARKIFMNNGGQEFHFVPGLNSEPYWAKALLEMIGE
ncbi:ferrochelatase [Bacteroidales bacterium]|nr:ferrochelatase [Bacteroidales bacterium]